MKIKIGVMCSATGNFSKKIKEISYELGSAIAKNGCVTITVACPGLPLEAARGASEAGGLVVRRYYIRNKGHRENCEEKNRCQDYRWQGPA